MTVQEFNRPTIDIKLLRLSAALLFIGELVSIVAGILHPSHEIPNNHVAVFAEYATSASWTAVHLGQFVGMAVIIAGLLTLFFAFSVRSGIAGWAGRLGAVAAAVALALYGLLQAVDGVALKQTVDAWASAPDAEKVARFAAAEAIRWMEWGSRSYQSFMLGLSLILFAILIVSMVKIPRPIGYLMALSGIAYLVQGWVLGSEGFSETNSLPTLLGYILFIAWSLWLFIMAWRMKETIDVPAGQAPMNQRVMAEKLF
jgi:uncharacterized protein DUF4386